MLTQLTINNFAIVQHLDIEFNQGMSVITGETGAGKSIAIDALSLCLGARVENGMVRANQERADICATFKIKHDNKAYQWLVDHELQDSDSPSHCILRRVINADGRSKAFINHIPVSATQLKELGQYLVHINGQHASQLLLKNDYQIQLLDQFCAHSNLLENMQNSYHHWKNLQQQVNSFQQKCAENDARKQLLQYQVDELNEFSLQENEYQDLEEEQRLLSNSEELLESAQNALNLLNDNDEANIDSMLYHAIQHLDELVELDSRYSDAQNLLNEALIQIQEATYAVQRLAANIEQDPARLADVDQRISYALQLARKHAVKPENLYQHHQQLKQELTELVDFSESEEQLLEQEKLAHQQLKQAAEKLSISRQQGALKLSSTVTKSIKQLAMENAEFSIRFESNNQISAKGSDNVTFMLRSNLGQQSQPLSKVASGGELSRIALTIQTLTSDKSAIPTLIFDEIDVGISGATASVVGKLLRTLGHKCQVLCVTHLPQVASYGHHHFTVEKNTVDQQTVTKMTALSSEQRVKALARLLGGSKITDTAIANAQEMLALAS